MRLLEVFLIRENITSFQILKSWLEEAIPVFVWRYMIDENAVKVCGYMSNAFGHVSRQRGIDMHVMSKPGHFVNVVETDAGWLEIDMTHIQFETFREAERIADAEWSSGDPHGERRALRAVIKKMTTDPSTGVKISKIDGPPRSMSVPDATEMNYDANKERARQFFGGTLPKGRVEI